MEALASIRHIKSLTPIEESNGKLSVACIDGWKVIVDTGDFCVNELVVYIKEGSLLPDVPPFYPISDSVGVGGDRKFLVKGYRIGDIYSQGIIFSVSMFSHSLGSSPVEHTDVTENLGVTEYLKPLGPETFNRGDFDKDFHDTLRFIPKQNLQHLQDINHECERYESFSFEKTIRMEGCFPKETLIDLWDGTRRSISELSYLLHTGEEVFLKGVDKDKKVVKSRLLKVHNNGVKEDWMEIRAVRSSRYLKCDLNASLLCTPNHVFFTSGMVEKDAAELHQSDVLLSSSFSLGPRVLSHIHTSILCGAEILRTEEGLVIEGPIFSNEQGSSLFDGLYRNFKQVPQEPGKLKQYYFDNDILEKFYSLWYVDGVKALPYDLDWVGDFAIGRLLQGAGSANSNLGCLDFCLPGLSINDCWRFSSKISSLYDVSCIVLQGKRLTIRVKEYASILKSIVPEEDHPLRWGVDEMTELFEDEPLDLYLGYESIPLAFNPVPAPIFSVGSGISRSIQAFDLQTETQNYFANKLLVHNSTMTVFHSNEWKVFSPKRRFKASMLFNWYHLYSWLTDKTKYTNRGVCSDDRLIVDTLSNYWDPVRYSKMFDLLKFKNVALQGVLCGPGVKGNPHNFSFLKFFIYDIFSFETGRHLYPSERLLWLKVNDPWQKLNHVPVMELGDNVLKDKTMDQISGLSCISDGNRPAKGVVYKSMGTRRICFSVLNPEYVLDKLDTKVF